MYFLYYDTGDGVRSIHDQKVVTSQLLEDVPHITKFSPIQIKGDIKYLLKLSSTKVLSMILKYQIHRY